MPPLKIWTVLFVASAVLTGCSSPGSVAEHPVANSVPALNVGVCAYDAVDVRPLPTRQVEPDFPPELLSMLSGKAVVAFTVRTDGRVVDPSIVQADDILFGEAAIDALQKWRFRPATVKGAPVDCRMMIPFFFANPYGYGQWEEGAAPASSQSSSSGSAVPAPVSPSEQTSIEPK
jgi:TonB family protein